MPDIRRLVHRITEALGPDATPERVEALAATLLDELRAGSATPNQDPPGALPRSFPDIGEHLGTCTVTLGISLLDCSSRLPQTVRARAYDKIQRTAAHYVATAGAIAAQYGARIAGTHIAVTPVALIADGHSRTDFIELGHTLDAAALNVGVPYLAGFSALVDKGLTGGDRVFIEALPGVLLDTERVCASVNCASTRTGINTDAVLLAAHAIKEAARLTAERDSIGCSRLAATCNAREDDPFVIGSFHGISGPEAVINVGISDPGVFLPAVRQLGPEADIGAICEAVKRTAFAVCRAGEQIGRRCAEDLAKRTGTPVAFGGVDLSLAPSPTQGSSGSVADLLIEMGIDNVGAPGTTAALILLHEAMKRGGMMAACHVGGLSAFMPLSWDPTMIRSAERDAENLEKPEPTSALSSAGLDLTVVPGDTPVETIAGLLLDAFAVGMINDQTTVARIIPVHGKGAGQYAEFGGLLGRVPIRPVYGRPNTALIRRAGRTPGVIGNRG